MAGEREERMKSVIGLKNVVIAQLLTDTDEETTYDTPEAVEGAIDMSITPNNADPDVQYADDIEFDVIQPDPEVTVALEMTQLPLDIRAGIEGAKLDDKGVMVQSANDTPPYYAIGAKAELRAGGFRYIWLLKCRATPMTEQYHTTEGATITRQTGQVEFTAIKRTSDGHWKYTADEGQNGFDATAAASFLSSVYTPTFTSGGSEEP